MFRSSFSTIERLEGRPRRRDGEDATDGGVDEEVGRGGNFLTFSSHYYKNFVHFGYF